MLVNRAARLLLAIAGAWSIASCGGSGDVAPYGASSPVIPGSPPPVVAPGSPPPVVAPAKTVVQVTLTGVAGSGLVLENNGGDALAVPGDGTYAFPTSLPEGSAYSVSIRAQPSRPDQLCTVSGGSGVASGATVTVALACTTLPRFAFVTSVSATRVFSVDDTTGALTGTANSIPYGGIVAPSLSPDKNLLLVAGVIGNDVRGFFVNRSTGALTEVPGSPFPTGGLQPQGTAFSPDGRFFWAANRASNTVTTFAVNSTSGALTAVGSPTATGNYPLAVAPSPDGKFLYVANYLGNSVSAYSVDAVTGALTARFELPVGSPVRWIVIDPTNKFLYVSWGTNALKGYAIDSTSGALTSVPGAPFIAGSTAQNMDIDPSGKWLYVTNEMDATVSAFSINSASGDLAATGAPLGTGGLPEGVKVHPNGKFVYVASQSTNAISIASVNPATGALTAATTAPMGGTPIDLAIMPD
ncbi:MAG: beta-propeller fold lactonase family protein [Variovorax sp.]|nr:beta-propeller fold lactonase family protein [Variovorax sp.]